MPLFDDIQRYLATIATQPIPAARIKTLSPLRDYLVSKSRAELPIRLVFVCTHNSRRSHLCQYWSQAIAHHFGWRDFSAYSGGTEVTSVFPIIITTIGQAGFEVQALSAGANPVYSIKYAKNERPLVGFSKEYNSSFNPQSSFCAVMTCDTAEEECPVIPGAEKRIGLTYQDPKIYDDSPVQAEKYARCSQQIAREMYYLLSPYSTTDDGSLTA